MKMKMVEIFKSCTLSNEELLRQLGMEAPVNAPPHWHNYTARTVRAKAATAVAAGNGDAEYRVGQRSSRPSATAVLPSGILAVLPAMRLFMSRKGVESVEVYIQDASTRADVVSGSEAILPPDVRDFLMMFGESDAENETALLDWAGVPTLKATLIKEVKARLERVIAMSETLNTQQLAKLLKAIEGLRL